MMYVIYSKKNVLDFIGGNDFWNPFYILMRTVLTTVRRGSQ